MADTRQDKVTKVSESRCSGETELQRLEAKVQYTVENKDRCIRVEKLVTSCDEAITKRFANEQIFETGWQNTRHWLNKIWKLGWMKGPLKTMRFQRRFVITSINSRSSMEHVTQWLWLWAIHKTNVSIKDVQPIENNRQRGRGMLIA